MKKLLYIGSIATALNFGAKAQSDFQTFLKARILLHLYETYYYGNVVNMAPYEKYHFVNMGFNNYKKTLLFLNYYYKKKDFKKVISELDTAVCQALLIDSIPQTIRKDENVWDQRKYQNLRSQYLNTIDDQLFNQLVIICRKDQEFRGMGKIDQNTFDAIRGIDATNCIRLIALFRKNGWLTEKRFDRYNNYDSFKHKYELFPIISHFERDQIVYFRNLAIDYAKSGITSWDDAVLLENASLWRQPKAFSKVDKCELFPLELTKLTSGGEIDWQNSLFELYTFGYVMIAGRPNLKIELFPTSKMLSQHPKQVSPSLNAIKNYLVKLGAREENISIASNGIGKDGDWNDAFFGYKIVKSAGGKMNWFSPYSLMIFN